MTTSPNFPKSPRRALALALPVLAVVVLVVAYRATAPNRATGGATGGSASTEVLQVGALPVT